MRAQTAAGRWRAALAASTRAERIATRLQRSEPGNLMHVWILGGTCYDQALLWDNLGSGAEAVKAARRALWAYHWLDPAEGRHTAVPEALGAAGDDPAPAAELIAQAADARARLSRLLAKYRDQRRPGDRSVISRYASMGAAMEADVLGYEALATYEALVQAGHYGAADIARVKGQYEAALAHLGSALPARWNPGTGTGG